MYSNLQLIVIADALTDLLTLHLNQLHVMSKETHGKMHCMTRAIIQTLSGGVNGRDTE